MSDSPTNFMGEPLLYSPPSRAGDHRPHPDDEYRPSRVTARAVTVDGSVVEQAHATIENAKTAYEKFLNGIPREHFSSEGLKEQISKFADTDAAKAVDKAVEQVRERADKAAAQVDKVRKQLSPNGDTAAELRATRYWNRTKAVLDSAKEGAFGAAQNLIANADREQLGTLLQELPSYLQARGHTSDWIDTAVGQVVPEYAQAAKQLKTANQAVIVTRSNAESLRKTFSNEGHRPVLVKYDPRLDPDK